MAQLKLTVPLIAQQRGMSCWYASACMVAYYREAGPRLGMPKVWAADTGLTLPNVKKLAETEGLDFLPSKDHDFTALSLMAVVGLVGPIWTACSWKGYGHVVVITGVDTDGPDGGTVFYNDPEPVGVGSTDSVSIKTLNENRYRGYLLFKPT